MAQHISLEEHRAWMRQALQEARRALPWDVPVGALVLSPEGRLITRAHNRREWDGCLIAHAEILALEEAGRYIADWRLNGCTLYVTLEPCPMCWGAILQSRLECLVYGAPASHELGRLSPAPPRVIAGVLEEECSALLKDFFAGHR